MAGVEPIPIEALCGHRTSECSESSIEWYAYGTMRFLRSSEHCVSGSDGRGRGREEEREREELQQK